MPLALVTAMACQARSGMETPSRGLMVNSGAITTVWPIASSLAVSGPASSSGLVTATRIRRR